MGFVRLSAVKFRGQVQGPHVVGLRQGWRHKPVLLRYEPDPHSGLCHVESQTPQKTHVCMSIELASWHCNRHGMGACAQYPKAVEEGTMSRSMTRTLRPHVQQRQGGLIKVVCYMCR